MLISAIDLLRAQGSGQKLLILDCRHDLMNPTAGEQAYVSGHLPGAFFVHMDEQLSGPKNGTNGRHPLPDAAGFRALLEAGNLQATTTLVAYDNNGGQFAARLWWLARWIGHDAVQVLDGGVTAWTAAGGALETGSSPGKIHRAANTTNSLPVLVKMPTVDVDFLIANLETSRVVVVDARAAPRFRGEVEPIDPVAGHIPHALNRPCSQNLGVDGCFKPADQLRREFLEMLGERKSQEIVHQCGSGVTACHNLLAMEVAGLCGSALYPGSWSEWVSDASRPVQTQHA